MDDYAPPHIGKQLSLGCDPTLHSIMVSKNKKQNYIAHNIFQNTYMYKYNYIASVCRRRLVMVNSACASCMPP